MQDNQALLDLRCRVRQTRMTLACLVTLCTAMLVSGVVAAEEPAGLARIEEMAAAAIRDGSVAGMTIAVARGPRIVLERHYGRADLQLDTPLPDNPVYEIGSVSKQFAAAAILQLAAAGKLSIDDPLSAHLPQFRFESQVTLRQLLHHTSGIKDFLRSVPAAQPLLSQTLSIERLIATVEPESFEFKPGEAMSYSNTGYVLLGLVVEKSSGMPYKEYVEEHLFKPAGMTTARVRHDHRLVKNLVHGYVPGPAGGLIGAPYWNPGWHISTGDICASARDLVAWNHALHQAGLLPAEWYRQLVAPGTLNDGTKLRYGMGLRVREANGRMVMEHGGGTSGFVSSLLYYPGEELTVVVLMNTRGRMPPHRVSDALASLYLTPIQPHVETPFAGSMDRFLGTYVGKDRFGPLQLVVSRDGDRLQYALKNRKEALVYLGDLQWQSPDGFHQFTFDADATTLRYDEGGGYHFLRRQ